MRKKYIITALLLVLLLLLLFPVFDRHTMDTAGTVYHTGDWHAESCPVSLQYHRKFLFSNKVDGKILVGQNEVRIENAIFLTYEGNRVIQGLCYTRDKNTVEPITILVSTEGDSAAFVFDDANTIYFVSKKPVDLTQNPPAIVLLLHSRMDNAK